MEVKNDYGKSSVVVLNVGQDDVDGLLINWDLNDSGKIEYMEKSFVDEAVKYLPEYSIGYDSRGVAQIDAVQLVRDAANSVIKIKRIEEIQKYIAQETPYDQWDPDTLKLYRTKGIFSKIVLHFLLRDMKGTLPLISKIYFKDSNAIEAHGFDAVYVTENTLWLGETKFYNNGKKGIDALIDDLNKHFKHDYLNEQFIIISKALVHNNDLREEWIQRITSLKRLGDIFKIVKIPLLCIYEDAIANDILDELNKSGIAETVYFDHVVDMKEYFDKMNTFPNRDKAQILLILLPVQSKDRIVSSILARICNMQNI